MSVLLRGIAALLAAALVPAVRAQAPRALVSLVPGEYEVTTQTLLPHLEEALRYATTRARRCLASPAPSSLFPLLEHPAFAGCTLVTAGSTADEQRFELQCANAGAASGMASFRHSTGHLSAVLELKMGGKNMTLAQRVHGSRLGPCSESSGATRD